MRELTLLAGAGLLPLLFELVRCCAALEPLAARGCRIAPASCSCSRSALAVTTAAYRLQAVSLRCEPPGRIERHWLYTVVIAALLLGYFDLRGRALSPALTEARLQALQARIRPHFLFNSINAVLSLIRSEPKRAETALEDLADLFRVLMADNRELTPLAREVELCRQYLDLEQLRLGERLRSRLACRQDAGATRWCRRWCCSR